jgi:hypothetical protein
MTISRRVAAALLATGAATGMFLAPGVASADKVKDCGTTVTETGPGNSGFTQTETETQTAACGSNSDQGEVITEGPVTNRGGGTPGGQQ